MNKGQELIGKKFSVSTKAHAVKFTTEFVVIDVTETHVITNCQITESGNQMGLTRFEGSVIMGNFVEIEVKEVQVEEISIDEIPAFTFTMEAEELNSLSTIIDLNGVDYINDDIDVTYEYNDEIDEYELSAVVCSGNQQFGHIFEPTTDPALIREMYDIFLKHG